MTELRTKFGRVDENNNVFLVTDGSERQIGQYPNVSAEEALAFYVRKFEDLAAQVRILEQRFAGKVEVSLLKKAQENLAKELVEPNVLGDITNLQLRVAALAAKLDTLSEAQKLENKASIENSIAKREAIAEKAVAIASTKNIQWKTASTQMTKLFEEWQAEQKANPKVPKSVSEPIWKKFSTARSKFETEKRSHFAALSASTKIAKTQRLDLIKRAEKLANKNEATTAEFRDLLNEWKATGKSNGKADEELWMKFKSFGDAIYASKKQQIEAENLEFSKNLESKLELIREASSINPEKDLQLAKNQLLSIQQKWEKIGKVPREKVREIENKLRTIENSVKAAEQELWRKSDPATKDRTNSVTQQLQDSITKLEVELEAAKKSKNSKAIKDAEDALAARKAWLTVVLASAN